MLVPVWLKPRQVSIILGQVEETTHLLPIHFLVLVLRRGTGLDRPWLLLLRSFRRHVDGLYVWVLSEAGCDRLVV